MRLSLKLADNLDSEQSRVHAVGARPLGCPSQLAPSFFSRQAWKTPMQRAWEVNRRLQVRSGSGGNRSGEEVEDRSS